MFDDEDSAGLRFAAAAVRVVASRVGTAPRGADWSTGGGEDRGLGFAAAFEGEGVVEAHGWCGVLLDKVSFGRGLADTCYAFPICVARLLVRFG